LVVELVMTLSERERGAKFVLRQPLHPNEQSALTPRAACPFLNVSINRLPATQVEIADAKVGPRGNEKGLLQCREQISFDVVENSRHGCSLARESACCSGDRPLWELWCLKKGTHLLASRIRHLGGPTEERFQRAPDGARLKRCPLREIPRFRCGQQPKLREFFCKKLVNRHSVFPSTRGVYP